MRGKKKTLGRNESGQIVTGSSVESHLFLRDPGEDVVRLRDEGETEGHLAPSRPFYIVSCPIRISHTPRMYCTVRIAHCGLRVSDCARPQCWCFRKLLYSICPLARIHSKKKVLGPILKCGVSKCWGVGKAKCKDLAYGLWSSSIYCTGRQESIPGLHKS
jgi:hypothetical protein